MRRLIIPAGATENDLCPHGDGTRTWTEVAVENGCEAIEPLDSVWCVENGVDGLGVRLEDVPSVAEVVPVPLVTTLREALSTVNEETTVSGLANTIAEALAPYEVN